MAVIVSGGGKVSQTIGSCEDHGGHLPTSSTFGGGEGSCIRAARDGGSEDEVVVVGSKQRSEPYGRPGTVHGVEGKWIPCSTRICWIWWRGGSMRMAEEVVMRTA